MDFEYSHLGFFDFEFIEALKPFDLPLVFLLDETCFFSSDNVFIINIYLQRYSVSLICNGNSAKFFYFKLQILDLSFYI